ncbi:Calcium-dependent lipid-binding transcriptional regulator plant protein [Dioscorea alata]|nr:Calcium-dependent lipid-binding transcriptional regulator plant protein [Dioscorea alata]
MDIDFRWGGDPNIILGVEALVASLPIQLKDLQVFTVIRVIFQLSEEIPCISAVVVALLSEPKPRFDYTLKAVGGSLTVVPGLSDMIDDTVHSIISDQLQWPHRIVVPLGGQDVDVSELELKPEGRLTVTVVKASDLKNMEIIGKSDPYVIMYVRPMFKVKTKVISNNLNPEWNEKFDMVIEDKETQSIILEVLDEDNMAQDKRLGIVKFSLNDLEPEVSKEIDLRLLPALDMLKIKDKKDRGLLKIKILYHPFTKHEQQMALEEEKRAIKERKNLKEAGAIGSTVDALGGAASLVGSGVGMVGSGIGAGVGMVGTGIGAGVGLVGSGLGAGAGLVGSGIGAGAGIVGSGIGAGAGFVGSGIGAVGSGLSKAGKFVGRSVTGQFNSSKRHGGQSNSGHADPNGS